jgi:hypothetical protein
MEQISRQLNDLVSSFRERLLSIPEKDAAAKPYPDKWSIKETLGHLIDSAANNHQRVVRMQGSIDIGALRYEQQHWVEANHYQTAPWTVVIGLWVSYNRHLAHVIAHVDPSTLSNRCDIGYAKPANLKFVIEDYLRHVEHHLRQILSGADPLSRERWIRREPD